MSGLAWVLAARDAAAIAALCLAAVAALAMASGVVGVTAGLAASVATASVAALAFIGLYGVAAALTAAPASGVLAALAVAALFAAVAAAATGPRGAWIGFVALLGCVVGFALVAAFARVARDGGDAQAMGAAGPAAAAALLALIAFGAIGAVARGGDSAATSRPPGALIAEAFGAPPLWFACAVEPVFGSRAIENACSGSDAAGAEGVAAAAGGADPVWSVALADRLRAAAERAAAGDRPPAIETASTDQPLRDPGAEAQPAAPGGGDADPPGFDGAPTARPVIGAPPERVAAAAEPDAIGPGVRSDPPPPAEAPFQPGAPETTAPDAPRIADPAGLAGAPEPLGGLDVASSPTAASADASGPLRRPTVSDAPPQSAGSPVGGSEGRLVCFPMLGVLAERLCPDRELTARDVSVRWRGDGGETTAVVEGVECFIDRARPLHATLVVALSGDLMDAMPRDAAAPEAAGRRADALYDNIARLVVAARAEAGAPDSAPTFLSAYVAGGSRLASPWVDVSFGPGRADRLLDLRSSGQSLALLRRLRAEIGGLRRSAPTPDLSAALAAAAADRPGADAQSVVILLVDASAAEDGLPAAAFEPLVAAFEAASAALFVIEIGASGPTDALQRLAERTGGAALPAPDGARLSDALERVMARARSFCAVRVSAPRALTDDGVLEIRLRRTLRDGCAFDQIAELSCRGLSMRERLIEP